MQAYDDRAQTSQEDYGHINYGKQGSDAIIKNYGELKQGWEESLAIIHLDSIHARA